MNKLINSTKAFWHRNKGKIAVTGILTTAGSLYIARYAAKEFNAFLDKKGLTEEYYALDEE